MKSVGARFIAPKRSAGWTGKPYQRAPTRGNTFQIGKKEGQADKEGSCLTYYREKNVPCSRAERISPAMYRVRYLEQTDKMSEQVHLRMLEEVYARELLLACLQHSPKRQQKPRRLQHFTALSVLWFLLAMVLWSRLAQGRVWDKLTHWLQDRYPQQPEDPAGASALSYQRTALGVEPLQWPFEQGTHLLCTPETPGAFYRSHRLMALDGSLFNVPDTEANAQAFG